MVWQRPVSVDFKSIDMVDLHTGQCAGVWRCALMGMVTVLDSSYMLQVQTHYMYTSTHDDKSRV